jgi:hypothetical protein
VNRVPVDLDELASFLDQPRRGPVRAFFDRATGQMEPMPRDAEVEGVFDDIVAAPERWIEIQPLQLSRRVDLRRHFLDQVNDPLVRAQLSEALAQPKAFARFDAVLRNHPALLDEWLRFRTRTLSALAEAWLSAIGVEAVSPTPVVRARSQ